MKERKFFVFSLKKRIKRKKKEKKFLLSDQKIFLPDHHSNNSANRQQKFYTASLELAMELKKRNKSIKQNWNRFEKRKF